MTPLKTSVWKVILDRHGYGHDLTVIVVTQDPKVAIDVAMIGRGPVTVRNVILLYTEALVVDPDTIATNDTP